MNQEISGSWGNRLEATIRSHTGVVAVVAPTGFGIGALVDRLVTSDDAISAQELDESTNLRNLSLVVFDLRCIELDHASMQTIERLIAAEIRVVLASRTRTGLDGAWPLAVLGPDQLRITESEAMEMAEDVGVSHSIARSIHVFTSGWPVYLTAAIREAASSRIPSAAEAFDQLQYGRHAAKIMARCMTGVTTAQRYTLSQLAHFDLLTNRMLTETLGETGFEQIRRAGVPIIQGQMGWFEILKPVRTLLQAEHSLDENTAAELAQIIVADIGVVAGAKSLAIAGQSATAARVLSSVPVYQLDEGSQSELLSVLRTVLDTEKDDGTLSLRLARVLHNRGDLVGQRKALERASISAKDQLRPDLHVEAQAEMLLLDLSAISAQEARDRQRSLQLEGEEHLSPIARIRLREVEAMLSTEEGQLSQIYKSAGLLDAVAREWAVVGEPAHAAATLRMMTATSLVHLGRYPQGLAAMERACELSADQPQSLAKSVELAARVTALLGDVESFPDLHDRAARLLEGAGLSWADGYLAWSSMVIAGFAQDASLVRHHFRRAEALLGDLLNHETGIIFVAEAAIAFALADDIASARALLDSVSQRAHESPLEFGIAEITIAARGSSSELFDRVESVRTHVDVPLEREWRIDLEVALSDRSGLSSEETRSRLRAASEEAERHGLGGLCTAILATAGVSIADTAVSVCLFGDFSVTRGGQHVQLPGGHVSELVKFLAAQGKLVPDDIVIDRLWSDISRDVGARRLKNVVNRTRAQLGEFAITRTEGKIGLSSLVTTDVAEFRLLVLDNPAACDPDMARRAIDLYKGPFLEVDLYSDWVESERQALKEPALSALDRALGSADTSPLWALDAARRIGPDHEEIYLKIVKLADRRGDTGTARRGLRLISDMCQAIGVDPPADYVELVANVGTYH